MTKIKGQCPGFTLSPEDPCNSRPPVPGRGGEGKDYEMTKIKGQCQGFTLSPEDPCNSRPPVPGRGGEGRAII